MQKRPTDCRPPDLKKNNLMAVRMISAALLLQTSQHGGCWWPGAFWHQDICKNCDLMTGAYHTSSLRTCGLADWCDSPCFCRSAKRPFSAVGPMAWFRHGPLILKCKFSGKGLFTYPVKKRILFTLALGELPESPEGGHMLEFYI